MSSGYLNFIGKCALITTTVFGAQVVMAAESNVVNKAEGTKNLEPLEQGKPSKIFRPYLPSNPFSDKAKFNPGPVAPVAPPQGAPFSSKRNEESLDRQRNWIFAQPEDADKSEKSEAVEDMFSAGAFPDEEKSKSVVKQFLMNEREREAKWLDEKEESSFSMEPTFGSGAEFQNRNDGKRGILQNDPLDPTRDRKVSGINAEQSKLAEMWRDQYSPSAIRQRENRQANMSQFENLFRPQSSGPSTGNGLGALGQVGFGVQPSAQSRGIGEQFNPNAPASLSDRFGQAPRGGAPGAGGLERPDVNSRVFGSSATTTQPVENRVPDRPPVVLQIPKRKF